MQGLYSDSYSAERGRFNGWLSYNYPFEETQAVTPAVSTVSMPEIYWNHVTNSGFTGMYSYQIDGLPLPSDIATHTLNDIGGGLETTGVGLFYGWLSAGWNDTGVADRERWMGFTKMLCTLGMVGGITGYFTVDDAFIAGHIRDGAVGATPPSWLWQMTDLGHAIALFSHLEDFVRGGTLVAGSRRHPYRAGGYFTDYDGGLATKRLYALDLPASETTAEGEPRSFVVARRHADGDRWILTAWCMQGPERDLTAQLPGVGPVVLRGRPAGSVYLLDRRGAEPVLRLLDRDAMRPTADLFPRGDLLAGGEIPADGAANTAPVITVPAAADPAVVLGATTALRAGAVDDGGAGTLRWSWRAASGTPAPVFARTGTAEAATTTVRFLAAGSYGLEATVRDAGGLTATTAVTVTVVPVPTGIRIEPAAVTVAAGGMVDLRGTVVDQFDTTLADPPPMAWSMADGPGTIDSRGRYTAPPAGTATATIQVVAGSLRRTVPVTVTVTGAPGGGGGGGSGGGCGAGALLAGILLGGAWLRRR
jgi:hypothetical protein